MSSTGEDAVKLNEASRRDADGEREVPTVAADEGAVPTVAVDGLTKRYGDTAALADVDLTAADGEFVSVVGPSGCGKSTLLCVLSGLEERFEGHAAVDGVDVRNGGSDAVGMVFQEPRLLPWADVRGNVAVGLPEGIDPAEADAADWIDELVETVGLDGFEDHRPDGLSGGMAQRVSLARGLAYEPEVLLLDEPFSALDRLTKYERQDNLLDVWDEQGTTVLLVTHDVEEAAYLSDRVVVLGGQPGTIVETVDVDVNRPRDRTDEELVAVRAAITDALGV